MDVSFKSCFFIAFLSAVFIGLAFAAADDSAIQLELWQTLLSDIPMPRALLKRNADVESKVSNGGQETLLEKFTNEEYDPTILLDIERQISTYFWHITLPNTPMPRPLSEALPKMTDGKIEKYDGQRTLSEITTNCLGWYDSPASYPSELLKQDSVTSLFLLKKDLIPGTILNIHFKGEVEGHPFAPYPLIRKMPPLTTKNLPKLLQFFSVSPNSKSAKSMNHTVTMCEVPNFINGRIQFCAHSLNDMVGHVISELKNPQNIKAISMPFINADSLMPYKIRDVQQLAAEQGMIVCHKSSFPVGIYYCHQPRGVVAYTVSLLRLQDNTKVDTYAICHYHTSDWSPEYIALKALGVPPGTSFCHFIESDMVIFYQG